MARDRRHARSRQRDLDAPPTPRWSNRLAVVATVVSTTVGVFAISAAWPDGWWPKEPAFTLDVRVVGVSPGQDWVLPVDIAAVSGAPSSDDCLSNERIAWVERLGGIPRELFVHVTILSNDDAPVLVTGLDVEVRDRASQPPAPTNVQLCIGGGPVPFRTIDVDLDGEPPDVVLRESPDSGSTDTLRLVLNKGEAEELVIVAATQASHGEIVQWTATLQLVVEGRNRSHEITRNGDPFVVAGCAKGPTWSVTGPSTEGFVTCRE